MPVNSCSSSESFCKAKADFIASLSFHHISARILAYLFGSPALLAKLMSIAFTPNWRNLSATGPPIPVASTNTASGFKSATCVTMRATRRIVSRVSLPGITKAGIDRASCPRLHTITLLSAPPLAISMPMIRGSSII